MRYSMQSRQAARDLRLLIADCRFVNRKWKACPERSRGIANRKWSFSALIAIVCVCCLASSARVEELRPDIYVPYEDLAHLVDAADKAVLMNRAEFEALLAAAQANARAAATVELGQVLQGHYTANVDGDKLALTGTLDVVSLGKGPVAVPLGFAQVGLTQALLDGSPAPLGYDEQGRLILIVTAKGSHRLEVAGTTKLQELSSGGVQFGISLPAAVAGDMKLSAPGDLEIHATVPLSKSSYDSQGDRTSAKLTLGGQSKMTVILLGNGRQEEDRAILLGESAATVQLTGSHQVLSCFYTVQVLRRGVREMQFLVPSQWTITEVTCPNLVRWSVKTPNEPNGPQTLSVRLRSEKTSTTALHIKALAGRTDDAWRGPRVILVGASYQRGYVMVNTDEGLSVRGEKLSDARREDISAVASVPGMVSGPAGRLYFHWGDNWSVDLDLATVELRRTVKERQSVSVSPEKVTLTGDFEVTAVGRELFDMSFVLGGPAPQWQIKMVQVDGQQAGFEYRLEEQAGWRLLTIELSRPIRPEKVANVAIELQHVPSDWQWPSDAADRTISVPLISPSAQTVSGDVLISALDDLDALPRDMPEALQAVPVGRMASLGIERTVQYAYSHNVPVAGQIQLQVFRRRPRTSAEAVGLVTVGPREFTGDWRVTYTISRASARRLYLLADKSLGQEIKITSAPVPISSRNIVTADPNSSPLSDELARLTSGGLAQRYDLWQLNLDHNAIGEAVIDVHYERPRISDSFEIPLVRPTCEGQISEHLAIAASEELALTIDARAAKEIDAVDLPPLPVEAGRVLAAFRLDAATTQTGVQAAVTLKTAVHESYGIPSALATSAELTTYLDVQGGQRTEAKFNIANAGKQFLTIRLPQGAELWSLRVGDNQAKPQKGAGGDYQVALGPLGKPVEVKIVYAYQPGGSNLERLRLGSVELPGVEINQMTWTVIPPPDYSVTTQETKMQTSGIIKPAPAYIQFFGFLLKSVLVSPALSYRAGGARKSYSHEVLYLDAPESMRRAQAPSGKGGYAGGMGGYGGGGGATPPPAARMPAPTTPTPAKPAESESTVRVADKPVTQKVQGVRTAQEGRFTLPVELVPTAGAGPQVRFTGLGTAELVIGLTSQSRLTSWWALGFMLTAAVGAVLARQRLKVKAIFVITVLSATSLIAVWLPATTDFANGAFTADIPLVLLYALVWLVRSAWSRLFLSGTVSLASVTIVISLGLFLGCVAPAAGADQTTQAERQNSVLNNEVKTTLPPVVIPYEGPAAAADQSDKILVPYVRFVELWNQAHPEDPIDQPQPGTAISLSDVQYKVTMDPEKLNLVLTAGINTHGKDWVVLGLPFSGLAVTQATLEGKPAQLLAGPSGMVLMVPGGTSGRLELAAVTNPEYMGRRGSASFSLPPLPGALMTVVLPENDLELEVDEIEAAPAKRIVNGSVEYTFGLGMTRKLALRWLPKLGGGAADRTLSANAQHDVYVFHWAIVGVSRITYNFSSGQYDRFALLVPPGTMLTELEGTNIRDFQDMGEQTVEERVFRLIEVRLHRAAQKQYEMTARWLARHAEGGLRPEEPTELSLIRAGAVSRESGTVTLHSAGGIGVKVAQVTGGRRADVQADKELPDAELTSDRARVVARYYWPYRPFALFVQLSRPAASPKVHLDQLVRINTDRVELLVQANLKAEQGKLFGASFLLPEGYELLSAVGPAVANFYERSGAEGNPDGSFLHIMFHRGQDDTQVALALVRRNVDLDPFEVPAVLYLDPEGQPQAGQKGRLAVQVAASLEAQTAASGNLRPILPATLKDWLDEKTIQSVQFAYTYEAADPSLALTVRQMPTTIRAEVFAGLVVRATAAVYTYRIRYNIAGSPVDHLSFRLPSEYARLVSVESQARRGVTQSDAGDGQTTWTVTLINEVTGVVDVAVNFVLPIDPSTSALQIAPLATEAPAGYRAIVAVQNMSRHETNVKDRTNLSDLAASEQQRLLPREMRESLQYVFESFEDTWLLNLEFKPAKMATRIQAVVDLLELTTVVDRSGRCRYEAKAALQNRSEQFLRVKIPQGLRLWSANVAGQPVKPVMAEDSAGADVLIPLVKTSPGGLPYDVYFYLADDGARPLVTPLNGVTRLKPPSISIVGIPVTQTTWSLRLPGGYRYMWPGGNMSPVAGTVEVLSLGIEAKIEQLKRLERTYRDVAGSSFRTEQAAKSNWDVFNKNLADEIGQAQSYLEAYRNQVGEGDYQRLKTKLGGQSQQQAGLVGSNTAFVQRQQEQARHDLNVFLNVNTSNAGVAEIVRNEALLEKPAFLNKNEEQQIARLEQELELSQQQLKLFEQQAPTAAEAVLKEDASRAAGTKAEDLIGKLVDEEVQMGKTLDQLARDTAAQIDRKQVQIRGQLEGLKDSRLSRHFQAATGNVQAPVSEPQQQARQTVGGLAQPQAGQAVAADQYAPERGRERFGVVRGGSQAQRPQGQPPVAGPQAAAQVEEGGRLAPGTDQLYDFGASVANVPFYTARAVYSLPVTLPEGEVRLDFARPSGEAELSLWAVSVSTTCNLYETIAIVAGLLVMAVLVKIWPRPQSKQPMSAKRAIGYALLLVILTLALVLPGLLVSLLVILVCEAKRGVFIRPAPGAGAV